MYMHCGVSECYQGFGPGKSWVARRGGTADSQKYLLIYTVGREQIPGRCIGAGHKRHLDDTVDAAVDPGVVDSGLWTRRVRKYDF